MKNCTHKKNVIYSVSLAIMVLLTNGCMGTSAISYDITPQGDVEDKNVVFPDPQTAWQKNGEFPNVSDLALIRSGISKDELYQLIGRPHFNESNRAREWDYIMKFYQPDDSIKVCQFKIIFDEDFLGRQYFWMPADCIYYTSGQDATPDIESNLELEAPSIAILQPPSTDTPQALPIVIPQLPSYDDLASAAIPIVDQQQFPMIHKFSINADTLFKFDKWQINNILPNGVKELDELANTLNEYQKTGDIKVLITGHTDFLGKEDYNLELSKKRASTVRSYLISRGINPQSIIDRGVGESQPIKLCSSNLPKAQLIQCLQPNRRVDIEVVGIHEQY